MSEKADRREGRGLPASELRTMQRERERERERERGNMLERDAG
jgi:hypothetical protein